MPRPARLGDAGIGADHALRQIGRARVRTAARLDLADSDRPVMLLGELAHLLGRGVAGDDQDRVVGGVELRIERHQVADGELLDVVDIAADRHAVGLVPAEQLLLHRLVEQRAGRIVGPHAPLLEHDLALGDQLLLGDAQTGHAVGFHAHHQLEPVGRHRLVVAGRIVGRVGVVAAAILRHGARELGGAHRGGALEHHVLEEMRDAGLAPHLVGAARLVDQDLGDDRRAARRQHDHLQAVRQGEGLGPPPFDREQLGQRRRRRRQRRAGGEAAEQGAAADHPVSEDAFEEAALAPRDGRRVAGGGLAGRLGVAQPLLLLGRVDDDAGGLRALPEDQAVDEGLVVVVERLGVLVDAAADVGVDAAARALAGLGNQRLLRAGRGGGGPPPAPAARAWLRPASAGDSASLAWSAGVTSCGRGSPGRGGRSSALGGMVSGECETILNSSGDTFLPPPRFSKALQPPSATGPRATRQRVIRLVRRIVRPSVSASVR